VIQGVKKLFSILAVSVTFLIQLLTLKELLGKDEHVHLLVAWLAHLVPTMTTVHDVPVAWVGFASGFRNGDSASWYTWLVVSVIVSFVVFVTKLVKEFDDPLAGALEAAGMAIGTIVIVCAMKFSWLCFSHGTALWITFGVISTFATALLLMILISLLIWE
jgi:hypothetical protein